MLQKIKAGIPYEMAFGSKSANFRAYYSFLFLANMGYKSLLFPLLQKSSKETTNTFINKHVIAKILPRKT